MSIAFKEISFWRLSDTFIVLDLKEREREGGKILIKKGAHKLE